jgi:hypothetical protein
MKSNRSIIIVKWLIVTLSVVTAAPAYCQVDDYVLLIEQNPVQGGKVMPSAGVHKFSLDEVVTLTAIPNPGYQFMYWLGDVSEAASDSTTVLLDGPKIIIAVFERTEFVFILEEEPPRVGLGRALVRNNLTYLGGGNASPSTYKKPKKFEWPSWEPEEEEDEFPTPEPEFPVPETDFPVPNNEEPIPEPATIVLMGLGGLIMPRRRRTWHALKENKK